ncbi:MAG: cytochrome c [Candidatus Thioglobus sp.]|nr:cytochrome c [Candidatus Thioglobus pontius]MBL6976991.1 cytochrome c [Candidatus Thioglobus sp.]MBL6984767.1 cytochrome c [Candidatus Thioglobus sp.]
MNKVALGFVTGLLLSLNGYAITTDTGARVPFTQAVGMKKFKENCAKCHGEWAKGTDAGPPLIHNYYKPDHHGDESFYRAALNGVQAHHWRFGNMPPVENIKRKDITKIINYVRWLQKANNLY